jgi:hypothetical protein
MQPINNKKSTMHIGTQQAVLLYVRNRDTGQMMPPKPKLERSAAKYIICAAANADAMQYKSGALKSVRPVPKRLGQLLPSSV